MATDGRTAVGRRGERAAARHLEAHGYRIVERNFRTREGELDLVAVRGATLVFCEVKTLVARASSGRGPAYPLEAVGPAKRARIRRLARAWLGERGRSGAAAGRPNARFDAIGVVLSPAGRLLRLEHVEAAF
jgi:putative endonuclease